MGSEGETPAASKKLPEMLAPKWHAGVPNPPPPPGHPTLRLAKIKCTHKNISGCRCKKGNLELKINPHELLSDTWQIICTSKCPCLIIPLSLFVLWDGRSDTFRNTFTTHLLFVLKHLSQKPKYFRIFPLHTLLFQKNMKV